MIRREVYIFAWLPIHLSILPSPDLYSALSSTILSTLFIICQFISSPIQSSPVLLHILKESAVLSYPVWSRRNLTSQYPAQGNLILPKITKLQLQSLTRPTPRYVILPTIRKKNSCSLLDLENCVYESARWNSSSSSSSENFIICFHGINSKWIWLLELHYARYGARLVRGYSERRKNGGFGAGRKNEKFTASRICIYLRVDRIPGNH